MQYTAKKIDQINNARKNLVEVTENDKFMQVSKSLFETGLNPNQIMLLSYIYDTMRISWTNGNDFYDHKRHNYYAVVTRDTASNLFNISPNTVGNIVQELCDIGYITKVQSWNSGVKVFVKHFSSHSTENTKFVKSRTQNLLPNKNQPTKNQSTSDTEHTSSNALNADDKLMKMIKTAVKQLKGNQTSQAVQENTINDNKDDNHVNYAVKGTNSLPTKAVDNIDIMASAVCGNNKKAKGKFVYKINGFIYKAKSMIAKNNDMYDQFKWENNPELAQSFSQSIYEMLYGAYSGTREFKCPKDAYFFGALKKFFTKFTHDDTESTQHVSKQKKTSVKGNHRIHEKLPDWARDGYNPKFHKISKSKKQAIQDRLKKLNAKLG